MDGRFRTRRLTSKDEVEIYKTLSFYWEEEAISRCLQLSSVEKDIVMKTYMKFVVPQGVSLGVFEIETDQMCACVFATEWDKNFNSESYEAGKHTPSLTKILKFDEVVVEDMPQIVNNRPYLHIDVFVVHPNFRRQGIAMHMVQSLEQIAMEKKLEMITIVANTYKSKELVKKMGFKLHNPVLYSEYREEESGQAIFKDIPPPDTGAVFCYKVFNLQ